MRLKKKIKLLIGFLKSYRKSKVFGIGNNKTGTTSLKKAMADLGYQVGDQDTAERMFPSWTKRDFKALIRYCRTGQFFQDIPFSKPYTFVVLDHEFPGSKFILTVRDTPEQWYSSLVRFQAAKWGKDGRVPTKEDLENAIYKYKGYPWLLNQGSYNTPEHDPYNKEQLIENYINYNESVIEYFRYRPEDLLILNVSEPGSYQKLCAFLGVKSDIQNFPWENKTTTIKQQQ